MSKFCTKCGSELANDSLFCTACGSKQEISANLCYENRNAQPSSILFNNVGHKIKNLASIIAWIGIAFSLILGIIALSYRIVTIGLTILFLGPLLSWVSSFCLYAFGQLVENSDKIVSMLQHRNGDNK